MEKIDDRTVFDWFQTSSPGDCLVYYQGFLAKDTNDRPVAGLWAIRNLYDNGKICLTQKKLGHLNYEYRATVRSKLNPVSAPSRFADVQGLRGTVAQ